MFFRASKMLGVYRQYDFSCTGCDAEAPYLVDVPSGELPLKSYDMQCQACGDVCAHERLLSMPAPYMGERNLSPVVHGGKFDTAGKAPMPGYPDMPGEAEYQREAQARLATLPAGASWEDRKAAMRSVDAPSTHDLVEHMSKPECREIAKERKRIDGQNKQKQKRLSAARRGQQVNFRRDRCAGDPKLA